MVKIRHTNALFVEQEEIEFNLMLTELSIHRIFYPSGVIQLVASLIFSAFTQGNQTPIRREA